MSFTSKNLQTKRNSMGFIKGATLFFLGMSCVLFIARAFEIGTIAPNAVQYIQKIFLTQDGSHTSSTGIILDGTANGGITIANLSNTTVLGTDANGKIIASSISVGGVGATGPAGPQGIQGPVGPQGPAGSGSGSGIGATGPIGPQGPIGPIGATGYGFNSFGCGAGEIVKFNGSTRGCSTDLQGVGGGTSLWSTGATGSIYYNLGNVGIGTINPVRKLGVNGDIGGRDMLEIIGGDSAIIKANAENDGSTSSLSLINPASSFFINNVFEDSTDIWNNNAWPMRFGTNNIERMKITADGNVGIGTSTPTQALVVNGTAVAGKVIAGNGVGSNQSGDISTSNGWFNTYLGKYKNELATDNFNYGLIISAFGSASSAVGLRVVMNSLTHKAAVLLGKVGIGTENPVAQLDVNGNIKLGQSSTTCDANHYGEMKYNGYCFQGCTPNGWEDLNSCAAPACGSINGTAVSTLAAGNCAGGATYGAFATHTANTDGTAYWTWSCSNLGQSVNCSANKMSPGVCGTCETNLCTIGYEVSLIRAPATPNRLTWSCDGTYGGATTSCIDQTGCSPYGI